jgi:hypothetical protein
MKVQVPRHFTSIRKGGPLMTRRCKWFALSSLLLALPLLSASPSRQAAQPPGKGDDKKADKKPLVAKKPAAVLAERLSVADLDQPLTLKDALVWLHEQMEKRGIEFVVLVDADAFKEAAPEAPDVYETQVRFPPVPKQMTVAQFLRFVLNRVPTGNATFILYGDRIEITTFEHANVEVRLQTPVLASFENRKLSDALRELSEMTGTTIIIDKRVGDKEDRLVSASFLNEVSLGGALRVLTEMADLKVVVLEGTIFVTTPAHAKTLREEKVQMDEQFSPLWPMLPSLSGRPAMPKETAQSVGLRR